MDAYIRARFYHVDELPDVRMDFPDLLMDEVRKNYIDRERDLGRGIHFRLERCTRAGDFLEGEFCRIQRENVPPQANNDGLLPVTLVDGAGIGHVAAFRYHIPTRVLLLQSNRQCGGHSRITRYTYDISVKCNFLMQPIMNEDGWERIKGKQFKSFRVKFSAPRNLPHFDDDNLSAADNARLLAEIYNGPEVEIFISVGRKKNERLDLREVLKLLRRVKSGEAPVSKLEATATDGEEIDTVDLVGEDLSLEGHLILPENNPDANYNVRRQFLFDGFSAKMQYIRELYGAAND